MADQKISAMPSASTLNGTEITPIVQTGVNKQVTTANYVSQVLDVNPVKTTQGGTNITSYTLGDTLYASASNVLSKLAGNTTTTQKFLTQTGTGSASAAPIWKVLSPSDINTQYGAFHYDYTTTTTALITQNSTADIQVVSTSGFSTTGHIIVGYEIIAYTGITPTSFTGISRGQHGSNSTAHAIGTVVGGAQATNANTPTLLQFNTVDLSNGVTLNTATSEISVAIAGVYNIQYSAQILNASTTQDLANVWFVLNGADIPASASWQTTAARANNNIPASSILTVNFFLSLTPSDKLTLKWLSVSGDSVIVTYPASVSPQYPSAPAVILTVNQVS